LRDLDWALDPHSAFAPKRYGLPSLFLIKAVTTDATAEPLTGQIAKHRITAPFAFELHRNTISHFPDYTTPLVDYPVISKT